VQGPVAEFNIQTDPDAAKIVFESGVDVTMVPLEVGSLCEHGYMSCCLLLGSIVIFHKDVNSASLEGPHG